MQKCRVCNHKNKKEIELRMAATPRAEIEIAEDFHVTESSLHRHWNNHVLRRLHKMRDGKLKRLVHHNIIENHGVEYLEEWLERLESGEFESNQ